ncbi:UDP-N-acetylmuramoyl-L-alanine--D-glutamate ligase, partial [bacterium]|nr:UDP-N-acetylmuramoyl-L-alanine--D-glutamate ligase [bacterium]
MQVANLNKRALVVGLGVSGIAAARLLCAQGFQVAVSDRRSTTELKDVIGELRQLGINEIETSGHSEALFLNQNLIIVSPGVPLSLPIFTKARAYGCEIIGEVELAARSSNLPMLALTGTNGKTTTVSLLGEVFQAAGVKAFVGGNLGRPAVEMVESGNDIAILELSSFQLEGVASFRPRIAVILNLTPDHQDRYSDSAAYLAAKVRISKTQEGVDFLVLNYDDPKLRVLGAELMARRQAGGDLPQVLFFSVEEKFVEKGGSWINGRIVIKTKTLSGHNLDLDFRAPTVKLPGAHNRSNYLAALLTALIYGLDEKSSIDTLSSFLGIPHRLEFVGSKAGVDYYNDSKATNI